MKTNKKSDYPKNPEKHLKIIISHLIKEVKFKKTQYYF
jgi:hypothetical protein